MDKNVLFFLISAALIGLFIVWISIAMNLAYRHNQKKQLRLIEYKFADIVSRFLYEDPKNPLSLKEIRNALQLAGVNPNKKNNIQFVINLMIRTQRSILGENYFKLQSLYSRIPPYNISINKVYSKKWYESALGIREIYEMNQSQYLNDIWKFRNNKNIYVRRESQIALVIFMGWQSLRFIPYLERKLTLWQQIKIVEKLYNLYPEPELKWLRKAYKTDSPSGKKLLMRIIRKYELHSEIDYILDHLNNDDYEIRETAIYCVSAFEISAKKMDYVKLLYEEIDSVTQQRLLLNYIYENSEIDLDFYLRQLYSNNEELKWRVAEILWNNGYQEKAQNFYYQQYPEREVNVA